MHRGQQAPARLRNLPWGKLETAAPDRLVPGRLPAGSHRDGAARRASLRLRRSTYTRIGVPTGWAVRPAWSGAQWQSWVSGPGVQPWLARIGGEIAGMAELELQPCSELGIVVLSSSRGLLQGASAVAG